MSRCVKMKVELKVKSVLNSVNRKSIINYFGTVFHYCAYMYNSNQLIHPLKYLYFSLPEHQISLIIIVCTSNIYNIIYLASIERLMYRDIVGYRVIFPLLTSTLPLFIMAVCSFKYFTPENKP